MTECGLPWQPSAERLGRKDLEQVLLLTSDAGADGPGWSREAWSDALCAGDKGRLERRAFGVRDETGGLAGVIVISRLGETMEIEWLLVRGHLRRKGLGGLLVRQALGWGRAHAVTEVLLEVRAANGAAQGLYAALGFALSGRRPRYYRNPDEDAILMRWS